MYIADSDVVMKGFERIRRGQWPRSNLDLWVAIKKESANRKVALVKVESHMELSDAMLRKVPFLHVFANKQADALAGAMAEEAALQPGVIEGVRWGEAITASVRTRLAAVYLDAAEKDKRAKELTPKEKKVTEGKLKRKAKLSQHQIRFEQGHVRCLRCSSRVVKASASKFLESQCIPGSLQVDTVIDSRLARGAQEVHASHLLYVRRDLGVHWCGLCGCHSIEMLRNLAKPCKRRLRRGGRNAIIRIRKNLLPGSSRAALAHNRARPDFKSRAKL